MASQVKIISSSFSSFNVSPESMININLVNNNSEMRVMIEARISNGRGAELIKVSSGFLTLRKGTFNTSSLGINIISVNFQNTALSEYVKVYHQLPSGKYNYCVSLSTSESGIEDELCDEIESENSTYMTLINPSDKDTIENYNPVLIWNHTESFNVLNQGEFYRLLVTEISRDQNAESAINVNNPNYQLNFVTRHDLLYPFDAPKLENGKRYGWQVQKVVNGVITNKTEAWEFIIKNSPDKHAGFVEITPKANLNPYKTVNNLINFQFKEEYSVNNNKLQIHIYDSKGEEIKIGQEKSKNKSSNLTKLTSDRYRLDLNGVGLKEGYYMLKILNNKNQEFILNFYYSDL
jgi:hypothetical protein